MPTITLIVIILVIIAFMTTVVPLPFVISYVYLLNPVLFFSITVAGLVASFVLIAIGLKRFNPAILGCGSAFAIFAITSIIIQLL